MSDDAPKRTVSSRSSFIREALRQILSRRTAGDSNVAVKENLGVTGSVRSPAKAFEFLVSPRSRAQKSGPNTLAQAATSPPDKTASAEGRAPLTMMSDFSQAVEEKAWGRAKQLADQILVLEEDNAMVREFVNTFALLQQQGNDMDFEVFPWADEGDTEEDDGSYYGAFNESDSDSDDSDNSDDDDEGSDEAEEDEEEDDESD